MARLPRYVLPPSGYYHVTTRGVDWTWIYRDDEDRRHFLRLLGIVVRRFGWNLDTFLPDGQPLPPGRRDRPRARCRAGMQLLNGTYAQRSTTATGRTGTSSATASRLRVIRDDDHLARTSEYVLTTRSARASRARRRDWPWSGGDAKANTCSRPPTRARLARMAAEELVVHGAREHNLKDITVRLPRNALICITGLSRLGQVEPRVRHDLRRGPAPLRREPLGLRAAVPADDGEAGRRLDRRPLAGDLDRPEDDVAATRARPSAPSPRSTTTCACSTRASAGRTARSAGGRSPGRASSRSSTRSCGCPRARASPSTRRSSATARASTATCSRSCAARASPASRSTASRSCSRSRSSSTRSSSTRSRSSSTGS